jgi:hypothetical protein
MRVSNLIVISLLAAGLPAAASAEVHVTPYVGRAFNGDADDDSKTYGGSIAFLGNLVGFEVDGAYTRDFYGSTLFAGADTDNNVTSLMGNLVLGPEFGDGRGRVFATVGAGLVKTRVQDEDDFFDVDQNDFGISAGAGLTWFLGDRLGARGDVRYVRDLQDPDPDDEFDVELGDLDYWRGSVGLSLRF